MRPTKRLTSRPHSSIIIWLTVYVGTFFLFLLAYLALVPSAQSLSDFQLPSLQSDKAKNSDEANTLDSISVFEVELLKQVQISPIERPAIEYAIKSGDSLERIFNRLGLSLSSLYEVLEADQEFLVLQPLRIKDAFTFQLDVHGELMVLTRHLNASKSVSYVRHAAGGFYYEENIKPVSYKIHVMHGDFSDSFYTSAKRLGLSATNVAIIHEIFRPVMDFGVNDQSAGHMNVVVTQGHINGVDIGGAQLDAIQIHFQGETHNAFLHSDGRFYDADGISLTPSLRRWPTMQEYRVSSPFNNKRLHPITGRISPHNGVDLATPNGTQVLATGEGVVTRVGNHRYAGRFIDVDYTGQYAARFLHLSKTLVKKGQKVSRDQVIALSGNSGRSTGAHLHYELHIKGNPVNPMTVDIPNTLSIPVESKAEFDRKVNQSILMMAQRQTLTFE